MIHKNQGVRRIPNTKEDILIIHVKFKNYKMYYNVIKYQLLT